MFKMKLFKYKTIIFDCDGVLLNSNQIKSEAFYQTALPAGEKYAAELLDFHRNHGGISRNKKFEYFLNRIVATKKNRLELPALLETYANLVVDKLLKSEVSEGLDLLRDKTSEATWFVISGGNELEIKEVFSEKRIAQYFNGGIFGSPKSKDDIFKELIEEGRIKFPAIYFGDSRYDHEVAVKNSVDFVFVSNWTEFADWRAYCSDNQLPNIDKLANVIS